MRRILSILTVLCLCFSCCTAETETSSDAAVETIPSLWPEGKPHRIEKKEFPFYTGSLDEQYPGDFPLYFADGVDDLPYVELRDFAEFLNMLYPHIDGNYQITTDVNEADGIVYFTRETDSLAAFNFTAGRIVWADYMAFNEFLDESQDYLHLMHSVKTEDSEGRPFLLSVVESRERHGDPIVLNLKEYGIPMLAQDGLYLVPLQTLNTMFLSVNGLGIFFNRQCLILNQIEAMNAIVNHNEASAKAMQELISSGVDGKTLTPEEQAAETEKLLARIAELEQEPSIYNTYMDGPKTERSLTLCDYGVRELAMELDTLYGVRENHDIDSFLLYFSQIGLYEQLISRDGAVADQAVRDLVSVWLDDGHSMYLGDSCFAAETSAAGARGFSNAARYDARTGLAQIRARYPEAAGAYYEVGDTAFVTLDSFTYLYQDYYQLDEEGSRSYDTIGTLIDAHRQITREDSPIKYVVLDLSQNTGGAASAAACLISWFLGDARLSLKDTMSGGETTTTYRADLNLDRVFDEKDTLAGRGLNLCCIISPASFSCGNLVPWAFKADGRVKLLGGRSGGGSCVVYPLTTAWGTTIDISGPVRVSFLKNGSYYDVDQGVEPDYPIWNPEHYYDRNALAEYIHSLY